MPIANTLKRFLDNSGISYDVLEHPVTGSSSESAEAAHVSGHRIAKGVVFRDNKGYLLTVLPASLHVGISTLNESLGRNLELVEEEEVADLFKDCELGAIPPVGDAYNVEVVLDKQLCDEAEIYFEAGDHREFVHVSGTDFQQLLKGAKRQSFAH